MAKESGYHTGITLQQERTDCSGHFPSLFIELLCK